MDKDSFKRNVIVANNTSEDTSFILLVFNHGRQIDFTVSGKTINKYQFDIKSGEIKDIMVDLQNFKDGFHAITYIILKDPDELPMDSKSSMDLTDIFTIRVNLLKNITNIPIERPNLFGGEEVGNERRIDGVFLGETEEKYNILFNENLNGGSIKFNLVYGNSSTETIDFYLVALLNNEQIPLEKQKYVYDKLDPDEEKVVPLEFNENLDEINNSFQVLMISSPFENVTKEDPFLQFNSKVSNKVTITR